MTIPNGWHIKYNPKPIPIRGHDWDFWHDEVDNDSRLCGTAGSEEEAKLAIMEKQEERHGFDKYANEPDDFDSHVNIESLQYIIADMQRDLLSRDNQITILTTKLAEQEAELARLRKVVKAAAAIRDLEQHIATLKADLAALREVEREKVAAWILSFGFATGHGDTIEDLLSEAGTQIQELRAAQEWVPVSERLPEKNTAVDLINVEKYVADDNLNEPFVTDVGYWNQLGYWAIRGERGMTRDAFTHWRARGPLPPQPAHN